MEKSKLKILFFIASLRSGGAERVASTLVNFWAEQGHEICFVTLDTSENDFYKLHNNIGRHELNLYGANTSLFSKFKTIFKRVNGLFKIIKSVNPDVVVSFMDTSNLYAIAAGKLAGTKVIISERTYPPFFNNANLFDKLRKFIYKFSNAFVAQTSEVQDWAKEFLPRSVKNIIIANPLPDKYLNVKSEIQKKNVVLAVGRLSFEKGFDVLIKSYAIIAKKYPKWSLEIVGNGVEMHNLETLINNLNMQKFIKLKGISDDISKDYSKAQIFVLSSMVEGFPNVLLEAMSHGLAPVSFDVKCGPRDLIKHNINGLLVAEREPTVLAKSIELLIKDEAKRHELSSAALNVRKTCDIVTISNKWLQLFSEIILK